MLTDDIILALIDGPLTTTEITMQIFGELPTYEMYMKRKVISQKLHLM